MRTGAYTREFDLPGWSEQSVWGYDELLECFWAQLWRDEDRFDAPRIAVSSYHLIPTIPALARIIADQIGINESEACLALLGRSRLDRVRTAIRGQR